MIHFKGIRIFFYLNFYATSSHITVSASYSELFHCILCIFMIWSTSHLPSGAVCFHPRCSNGGHPEQRDRGARLTAAQLCQQHPHAQFDRPHTAGKAVQGEWTLWGLRQVPFGEPSTSAVCAGSWICDSPWIWSLLATCLVTFQFQAGMSLRTSLKFAWIKSCHDQCFIKLLSWRETNCLHTLTLPPEQSHAYY